VVELRACSAGIAPGFAAVAAFACAGFAMSAGALAPVMLVCAAAHPQLHLHLMTLQCCFAPLAVEVLVAEPVRVAAAAPAAVAASAAEQEEFALSVEWP
jgi:hypothetical protein